MTLQERMRELRKERKETQRQVADAIGVTDRQYQRFETGVNLPGFENLVGIADHFGVSLDYWPAGRTGGRCRGGFPPFRGTRSCRGRTAFSQSRTLRMLLSANNF